jgi:oligoendopeptidase F
VPGSERRPPRWDLSPIYPGFDSDSWQNDKARMAVLASELLGHLEGIPDRKPGPEGDSAFEFWLVRAVALLGDLEALDENLSSYAYSTYSTDTRNERALKELNACEELGLPARRASVAFRNAIASRADEVVRLASTSSKLVGFGFFLTEELFWQSKQMGPELEDLAADLGRSGGDAWMRLQEAVSSTTSAVWDAATGERRTVIQLRNLAYDPDRSVRRKAFDLELEAWKSVEVPLAAALNGVKGFMITLNKRRGWETALDKSLAQSRITRKTLDALIGAMTESLPVFRSYLNAKAKLLGIPKCAFYDLFAPVGEKGPAFSFEEASRIVVENYAGFSPDMGAFAKKAIAASWVDAEPREGKVGGAYCIDFPLAGESRVLLNYEGSFASIKTLAHELGHAWHHEAVKDLPKLLTNYPMTLAETASIFGETIVFEGLLPGLPESARLGALESHLKDPTQVIVDILSRFIFEREVCERRERGELSPAELCELMVKAQRETYGDGLDENCPHPYMWAVKSHYYSPDLAYYNFPYAFGQLFALGLYARWKDEGPRFAETYRTILRETGRKSAVDVTKSAGFDIETKVFWKSGLDVIAGQIGDFKRLAETSPSRR